MTRTLVMLAVAVGCACGGTRLADVPSRVLEIRPDTVGETGPRPNVFAVRLNYDPTQGCAILSPEVKGTVNGQEVEVFPGAEDRSLLVSRPFCILPRFTLPLDVADAPEVTVAFEDGDVRLEGTFRNLGTPPTLKVTPPADGHIRVGSTIGLDWSPATDDLSQLSLVLTNTVSGGVPDLSSGAAFHDGHAELTINNAYTAGPSLLQAMGQRRASVVSCTTSCTAEIDLGLGALPVFNTVRLPLTVEP